MLRAVQESRVTRFSYCFSWSTCFISSGNLIDFWLYFRTDYYNQVTTSSSISTDSIMAMSMAEYCS
jgi:hypothetical protein